MVGEGEGELLWGSEMATQGGSTAVQPRRSEGRAASSAAARRGTVVLRRGDIPTTFDVTAAPRAVLRESLRLLGRVLGEARLGNAHANVRAAIRADEERARARAEVARMLEDARRSA